MCSKIKDSYKEELDKKLSTKGSRERLQTDWFDACLNDTQDWS